MVVACLHNYLGQAHCMTLGPMFMHIYRQCTYTVVTWLPCDPSLYFNSSRSAKKKKKMKISAHWYKGQKCRKNSGNNNYNIIVVSSVV